MFLYVFFSFHPWRNHQLQNNTLQDMVLYVRFSIFQERLLAHAGPSPSPCRSVVLLLCMDHMKPWPSVDENDMKQPETDHGHEFEQTWLVASVEFIGLCHILSLKEQQDLPRYTGCLLYQCNNFAGGVDALFAFPGRSCLWGRMMSRQEVTISVYPCIPRKSSKQIRCKNI